MEELHDALITYAIAQRVHNGNMMVAIEAEAHELVDYFQTRRKVRQAEEQRRVDAEAAAQYKKPERLWCPLNLRARTKNGTLVLEWQLIHYSKLRKVRIYKSIPNHGKDYDLRTLFKHAQGFERDLVEEYERMARELRKAWRKLVAVRRAVRCLVSEAVEAEVAERAARVAVPLGS